MLQGRDRRFLTSNQDNICFDISLCILQAVPPQCMGAVASVQGFESRQLNAAAPPILDFKIINLIQITAWTNFVRYFNF